MQIASGTTLKKPVRRGPHGVSKYAVQFLPGRPGYAPNMAGVDMTKLRTYQLIVRFVDINDANTKFRCVIELRKLFFKLVVVDYLTSKCLEL